MQGSVVLEVVCITELARTGAKVGLHPTIVLSKQPRPLQADLTSSHLC